MKEYKINDIPVFQDELTVAQDQSLAELISSLELGDITDLATMKLSQILKALSSEKALTKFFSIILTNENGDCIDELLAGKIKNSQMEEIIKDFFILNPKVKELLTILKAGLTTMNSTSISSASKGNSSPSHPVSPDQQLSS